MRKRIEDLGIISEKLHVILQNEVFDNISNYDFFMRKYLNEEGMEELIDTLFATKEVLNDCWCLARFGDDEDSYEDYSGDIE